MYAYRADFNWFREYILGDGRLIRRVEQPGGGAKYTVTDLGIAGDTYLQTEGVEGHWTEMNDQEIADLLEAIEE